MQGVENIYTQHKPLVAILLDQMIKGKLKESSYPYVGNSQLRDRSEYYMHIHIYTNKTELLPQMCQLIIANEFSNYSHGYIASLVSLMGLLKVILLL